MAIGGALGQYFTYGIIEDAVRLRTKTIDNANITSSLFIAEINSSLLKVANILNGLSTRFYGAKSTTLTMTGSGNPYIVDLTSLNPFPVKIARVTHVTTGGVRTYVGELSVPLAEAQATLTYEITSSVFYADLGDSLEIWAAPSFTITTASDKIHVFYFRQPITASVTRTSKLDMLDIFAPFVMNDVAAKIGSYVTGQPIDPSVDQKLNSDILTVWKSIEAGAALGSEARP